MASSIRLEWMHGSVVEELPPLDEGAEVTFGRDRSCTLVLAPRGKGSEITDHGISRHAGTVSVDGGAVVIANTSKTRPLDIRESTGLHAVVPIAGTRVIADLPVTVVVTGAIHRHGLRISTQGAARLSTGSAEAGSDASMTQRVPLPTAGQRMALTAMFEGYLLEFPRWDPNPTTYEGAGARLGLKATAVRRRIEEYREKLKAAAVAGLEVQDARPALADLLLSTRIITAEDLTSLPPT